MNPDTAAPAASDRRVKTRVTLALYLILLLWRGYSHVLPNQLRGAPLVWAGEDGVGHLYKWLGLQEALVYSPVGAWCVTALVFLSASLLLLYPLRQAFAWLFSASFFLIGVIANAHLGATLHYLAVLMLLHFVFWPRSHEDFALLWDGMRYYLCFVYCSAFVWKLVNGAFHQPDFGMLAFKPNLSAYLINNPETFRAHVYYFLLRNAWLVNTGAKLVFWMECAFVLGFLTRRLDRLLLALSLLIPVCTYYFVDTLFVEGCVASVVLVPQRCWARLGVRFAWLGRPFVVRRSTLA